MKILTIVSSDDKDNKDDKKDKKDKKKHKKGKSKLGFDVASVMAICNHCWSDPQDNFIQLFCNLWIKLLDEKHKKSHSELIASCVDIAARKIIQFSEDNDDNKVLKEEQEDALCKLLIHCVEQCKFELSFATLSQIVHSVSSKGKLKSKSKEKMDCHRYVWNCCIRLLSLVKIDNIEKAFCEHLMFNETFKQLEWISGLIGSDKSLVNELIYSIWKRLEFINHLLWEHGCFDDSSKSNGNGWSIEGLKQCYRHVLALLVGYYDGTCDFGNRINVQLRNMVEILSQQQCVMPSNNHDNNNSNNNNNDTLTNTIFDNIWYQFLFKKYQILIPSNEEKSNSGSNKTTVSYNSNINRSKSRNRNTNSASYEIISLFDMCFESWILSNGPPCSDIEMREKDDNENDTDNVVVVNRRGSRHYDARFISFIFKTVIEYGCNSNNIELIFTKLIETRLILYILLGMCHNDIKIRHRCYTMFDIFWKMLNFIFSSSDSQQKSIIQKYFHILKCFKRCITKPFEQLSNIFVGLIFQSLDIMSKPNNDKLYPFVCQFFLPSNYNIQSGIIGRNTGGATHLVIRKKSFENWANVNVIDLERSQSLECLNVLFMNEMYNVNLFNHVQSWLLMLIGNSCNHKSKEKDKQFIIDKQMIKRSNLFADNLQLLLFSPFLQTNIQAKKAIWNFLHVYACK